LFVPDVFSILFPEAVVFISFSHMTPSIEYLHDLDTTVSAEMQS